MYKNKTRYIKIISILSFILITINLIYLKSFNPEGYILDIYSMFPFYFYISLIFCYFIAVFLVFNEIKKIGTLVLCFNHLILLIIPYMLKYYSMGRADDMTYIGEYVQIVNSGYIGSWNIYPASHIIGSNMSIVLNVEPHLISFIIPILFSFIFISGMYLFSQSFFIQKELKSLSLVSSFILYLGVYNYLNVPHALFFAYIPLYLYVFNRYVSYSKKNKISYSLIFVLMTLIIPYTHPFIAFFVMALFTFHLLLYIAFKLKVTTLNNIPKMKYNSLILLFTAYISWFIYQGSLLPNLVRRVDYYFRQVGRETVISSATIKLTENPFEIYDYLKLSLFFYGRFILPTLIILACFVYIWYNKKYNYLSKYWYLIFIYILFFFIQVILIFNPVVVHHPDRILNLNFIVYAQIPLFSLSLYILFFKNSKSFRTIITLCIILSSIWTVSLFGAFDSPNVYRPNVALTHNEVQGMKWFSDMKGDYPIGMVLEQTGRYPDIFGFERSEWIVAPIPFHLGYDLDISTFDEIYFRSSINDYNKGYVALTTRSRLLYTEMPKKRPLFTNDDFIKFEKDTSVAKIYDSMDIKIYNVYKY